MFMSVLLRRMRLAVHVTHERGEICMKITKATRKTTLGSPRHRWENVINICLKEMGWEYVA